MRGTSLLGPIAALSLIAGLAACSQPAETSQDNAVTKEAAAAAPATLQAARPAVSIPQLAYSYSYLLSAPADAIRQMVSRHENACVAAGAATCQITGASVSGEGQDRISGALTLRATPEWLAAFRARLETDIAASGGRVVESSVDTDDLSRSIVDTEAAIRAQTVLRDRMEDLLANSRGKLPELIELRKQLAEVQGQLDAGQSELRMMRARVSMAELKITYESGAVLARDGAWAPLGASLGTVVDGQVAFLSGLVMLLAWVGPWLLLAGGGVWVFRRVRAKRPAA